MTDYKTIFGKKIKFQTSDLTMSTATEGELFYSDTDSKFKVGVNLTAWASGGNLTGSSVYQRTGFGIQTAAVAAGGTTNTAASALVEEYDGSSWSEVNNIPAAKYDAGSFGTLTAGMVAGGLDNNTFYTTVQTEEYDGTNWTEGGDLPQGQDEGNFLGILTAGLMAGGVGHPNPNAAYSGYAATTAEYDGSSWTAGNNLNTARGASMCFGTQTAGLVAGGIPTSGNTELYDGTNWTEVGDLNTARAYGGSSRTAAQTAGVVFGGGTVNTEEWDGSSWTESGDLSTARHYVGSIGSQTAAMCLGGSQPPPATAIVEEYNGSSWTSGTALMAATQQIRASGNASLALAYAGYNTTFAAQSYLWNDTTWITQPSLATGRSECAGCASGSSSTAAFACGGEVPARVNTTENFTGETTADTASTIDFD